MSYLQKKKLAFMSIVNKVKGFVRTIIGIPPLTLPNCVDEDSLISYKIYGDSVQDGTPSPDNPIEVVSVGEKTRNLLDISTAENKTFNGVELSVDYVTQKIKAKGVATANGGRLFYLAQVTLPAGTYYFSSNTELPRASLTNVNATSSVVAWCNRAFTLTETTTLGLGFNVIAGTEYDVEVLLQITEGDSPKEYEPFGYKIPVKAKGKNLIPYPYTETTQEDRGLAWTDNGDGSITVSGVPTGNSQFVLNTIPITGGKQYTLYRIAEPEANINWYWSFFDAAGVKLKEAGVSKKVYTLTAPDDATTIKVLLLRSKVDVETYGTIYPMLLEGAITQADYEPFVEPITTNIYLDEPLRKTGSYIDYIDSSAGVINIKTSSRVIDDNEAVYQTTYDKQEGYSCFYFMIKGDATQYVSNRVESNYLPFIDFGYTLTNVGENISIQSNGRNVMVIVKDETASTVDEFKAWLKSLSDNGKPFRIWYTLRTNFQFSKEITLPSLPTFKGTTVYEVDTTVQPSNMEVTYYSTSKE